MLKYTEYKLKKFHLLLMEELCFQLIIQQVIVRNIYLLKNKKKKKG